MSNRDRPYGAVKVASLIPFASGRRTGARQVPKNADDPNRRRKWEVGRSVDLFQIPLAGHHGDRQPGEVQSREGEQLSPGDRIADLPVNRIRAVLDKADDEWTGLR